MRSRVKCLIFCLIAPVILASSCFAVVYVDQNAPGPAHDGTTWDTAFAAIQEGIEAATPGGEVWVADGVYVENVVMGEGVAIYGGFLGAEPGGYEEELGQRDFENNVTAIDGSQSGSCVVMAVESRVDGFTVTNGCGEVGDGGLTYGGGIYCDALGETSVIVNNTVADNSAGCGGGICCWNSSSPTITDNTIIRNTGEWGGGISCVDSSPIIGSNAIMDNPASFGGGLFCQSSASTVTNNTIHGNSAHHSGGGISCLLSSVAFAGNEIVSNTARSEGGGIYSWANTSLRVAGNEILGNSAKRGGGVYSREEYLVAITRNTIADNTATNYGGGICCASLSYPIIANNCILGNTSAGQGGGIACTYDASPAVTSNVIVRNSAQEGGGINSGGSSSPSLANNVVVDNNADFRGGGVYWGSSAPASLSHNDLWANTPQDYYGCEPGEGDISEDPMFVDPQGEDFHLQVASPCIDAGDNAAAGLPQTDFEGDLRVLDGNGDEVLVVDIGVDEVATEHHVVSIIDLPIRDVTIDEDSPLEFAGTAYHTGGLDILDYLWRFGEGSGIPDAHVEDPGAVAYDEPGSYVVTFDAQDEYGGWCQWPDTRTITVLVVLPEAVIDAPESPVKIDVGDYVVFEGTATDANGVIVDWLWTFSEGSGIPDIHVEDPGPVQFNNPGTFDVTFNAQDDDGHWDPDPDSGRIYVSGGPIMYVDQNAPGPLHNGAFWDTAYLTIKDALRAARAGHQLWVADGTYDGTFRVEEGLSLYGGFLGAEEGGYEESLDQRDLVNNVTTIVGSWFNPCVMIRGADVTVDGFTITDSWKGAIICSGMGPTGLIANNTIRGNGSIGIGCGPGSSPTITGNRITDNSADSGTGIYCVASSPTIVRNVIDGNGAVLGAGILCEQGSAPLIAWNCIDGNSAGFDGGGISICDSSPTVTDNYITRNFAREGGAIHCRGDSSPILANNCIVNNWAGYSGAGICCEEGSSPTITGNIITDNSSGYFGGGICCWGSSPTVTNNTIAWNGAREQGGGIHCKDGSSPIVSNNIVSQNSVQDHGGGIWCSEDSSPSLSHNDLWENSPDDYCGCDPGEGDISADPMLVDPEEGNWHLSFGSPCIDAGTNYAPGLPETDWEGEPRVYDGDGDEEEYGVYATVDMGADEFVPFVAVAPDPQPECDGPLFGLSQSGFPAWVWFSIPIDPDSCCNGDDCYDPATVLGFPVSGHLWRWDKYNKFAEVYQAGFVEWDLAVGEGYLLFLWTEVPNPSYLGVSPFTPFTFEHKLGRQGWTWIGMPGLTELAGEDFMSSVKVTYPSDETGEYRTAAQDYAAIPNNWITWGWPFWDTYGQWPKTFTPYAPFGHNTCHPWIGYRVWVNVGAAVDEGDPDQVTLIWPYGGPPGG